MAAKKPPKRVVTWQSTDKAGNESAFAIVNFNVRDYGAVGDGSTDDTAAINAAIAAANQETK